MDVAGRVAEKDGVALNQLINVAVAEKLPALRTVILSEMCVKSKTSRCTR